MLQQLEAEAAPSAIMPAAGPTGSRDGRLMRLALAANIFISAFLLFQVQLIIGKYILPMFGGAPSIWITCILCFQMLLLAGYCYSHLLSNRLPLRAQGTTHAVLLVAALLFLVFVWLQWPTPLTPGADWKPQPADNPVWKISQLLAITVAIPFFLLSTTGPLFQNWFARIEVGRSPYRLYALSNAGSLLGLLSYPFLFEWLFTLKRQAQLWSSAYALFVSLSIALAWRVRAHSQAANLKSAASAALPDPEQSPSVADAPPPPRPRRLLWVALSACSSTMLLATTNLLCQDLTSLPLLWVLPLSLYLLSFILTFDNQHWYSRIRFWPIYFVAVGLSLRPKALGFHGETPDTLVQMALYCFALFSVCMVCHGELARSKPAPRHVTSFYLLIGSGGAIGGLFVVLLAPILFSGFWEFRVTLLACGALLYAAFRLQDRSDRFDNISWTLATVILFTFLVPHIVGLLPPNRWFSFLGKEYFSGAVAAGALAIYYLLQKRAKLARQFTASVSVSLPALSLILLGFFGILTYVYIVRAGRSVLYRERNFFGVKYVLELSASVDLMSGSTIHGVEAKDPASQKLPTMYYRRDSGIGMLIANFPRGVSGTEGLRIGVIGLGIGTLAAYGHPTDYFRFYEIDPALLPLSLAPKPYFHFLKNTAAAFDISMGDARLSLEREAARGDLQRFNVLVVDAFSSDAVPVHLLTREAMELYLRHLRTDNGVLAFHVSSRFVDLAPVIVGLTESFHLHTVQVGDKYSLWILASQNPAMLRLGPLEGRTAPVLLKRKPLLWTDDYSNVEAVLVR